MRRSESGNAIRWASMIGLTTAALTSVAGSAMAQDAPQVAAPAWESHCGYGSMDAELACSVSLTTPGLGHDGMDKLFPTTVTFGTGYVLSNEMGAGAGYYMTYESRKVKKTLPEGTRINVRIDDGDPVVLYSAPRDIKNESRMSHLIRVPMEENYAKDFLKALSRGNTLRMSIDMPDSSIYYEQPLTGFDTAYRIMEKQVSTNVSDRSISGMKVTGIERYIDS